MQNAWGTKRNCLKCGSHFYDLNKNPAKCPKCGYAFDPTLVVRPRRGRGPRRNTADEMMMSPTPLGAPASSAKLQDKEKKTEDVAVKGAPAGDDLASLEDDIEEISDIENLEEDSGNKDDADDESILEDLEKEKVSSIVDTVQEEEEEEEEEEETEDKKKPKKKKKKSSTGK